MFVVLVITKFIAAGRMAGRGSVGAQITPRSTAGIGYCSSEV